MARKAVDKAALARFLDSEAPFLRALGIVCEDVSPGYAVARWKPDARWLRPGGDILATARVIRMGRRITYGEVHLAAADQPDRLIAHATSSYALIGDAT